MAREQGWTVEVEPAVQSAEGLLAALADRDLSGRRVWIPSGDREGTAVRLLPPALAERGAEVEVFEVYAVRARSAGPGLWEPLAKAEPGAIVFHSPSAVDAVVQVSDPAVGRWRTEATWVAIGETTAGRCRETGEHEVVSSPEPSDPGVVAALASIGTLGVREREA